MAKLLSDQTASELPEIFEAVRSISQATRGRPIRRDRGIGGSSRAFVEITEVTDAENYSGNVVNPEDLEVIEEDVEIKVIGAITNDFAVGYSAFADLFNGVYYLDGTLLG